MEILRISFLCGLRLAKTILCLRASPGLRFSPRNPLTFLMSIATWPGTQQDCQIKKTPFQVSLLWCIEYGSLSASRNIFREILRISFLCGWDVKLSTEWSEKVEPQGDFPPAVLPSQAVPGKYFRPHLVNWDDFAPSMTSARITPPPAVAAYRLTPELSGFSHIWDKLASIFLNGKCCRSSNNSRLRKLSLYSLT